jgi:hypothetical protein
MQNGSIAFARYLADPFKEIVNNTLTYTILQSTHIKATGVHPFPTHHGLIYWYIASIGFQSKIKFAYTTCIF